MRAADADRERMAAFLGQCYAEGRLNGEELSTRVEAAYRAVTYADLAAVASDLPTASVARPGERLRRGVPRTYSSGGLVLVALPTYALIDVLFPLPFLGTLALLVGVVVVTWHLALRSQPGARAGRPVLRPDLGPQSRAADREASHARRLPRLTRGERALVEELFALRDQAKAKGWTPEAKRRADEIKDEIRFERAPLLRRLIAKGGRAEGSRRARYVILKRAHGDF